MISHFGIKVIVYFGMDGWVTAFPSVYTALLKSMCFISYKIIYIYIYKLGVL